MKIIEYKQIGFTAEHDVYFIYINLGYAHKIFKNDIYNFYIILLKLCAISAVHIINCCCLTFAFCNFYISNYLTLFTNIVTIERH